VRAFIAALEHPDPMPTWLQTLVDIVTRYPEWAFAVIFLVAFVESLAGIGLIIPGTLILFSLGALVGLGALDFWTATLACTLGAICGDLLSFWVGYKFRHRILKVWPFSKYPQAFDYCHKVFDKHGGKSYFFGRFFGPLRAFMNLIAGMMEMPWPRFGLLCVIACSLWAPLYLAPGIAFGTSIELAGEAAGRLVIVLIGVGAVALLLRWIVIKIARAKAPTVPEYLVEAGFGATLFLAVVMVGVLYLNAHPCTTAQSCAHGLITALTSW
jgi:membrane protein DedA with SNARE-associated domain